MNLETKITIYEFTPQVFTLTLLYSFKEVVKSNSPQRKRKEHIAPFYLACL